MVAKFVANLNFLFEKSTNEICRLLTSINLPTLNIIKINIFKQKELSVTQKLTAKERFIESDTPFVSVKFNWLEQN
jgi:hypothetical protein